MPLPPEAVDQLRSILSTYERLRLNARIANVGCDDLMRTLGDRLSTTPGEIGWPDVSQADLCVIEYLTDTELRARLGSWRRRMSEVLGDTRYAQYLSTAPSIATAEIPLVKADLQECVRAVYYFYGAYGIAARSRSEVTKQMLVAAVVVLIVELILAYLLKALPTGWFPNAQGTAEANAAAVRTVLAFVLAASAAAVVGSVVSVQRRLQDPKVDVDPFFRYIQTKADRFSIAVISPIYGAVFGAVMYVLLASTLLSTKLVEFNNDAGPKTPKDVAALLVLGFLAGFAEQLVPDALTRIAARALGGLTGGGPSAAGASQTTVPATNPAPAEKPASAPSSAGAVTLRSAKPSDLTPEAAALGHDAALASAPNPEAKG